MRKGRVIIAFVFSPLVVPVFFFIAYLFLGNGLTWDNLLNRFIGTLINYGAYAYIFTLILGIPTLLVLVGLRKTRLLDFLAAGALLSVIPCIFFYVTFGTADYLFYIQSVVVTLLATAVFWYLAFGQFRGQ